MAERMLAQFASNDDEVQFRPMFFGGFWLLHATDLDPEGPVQGIARFNCYLEFPDVRHLARVVRLEKNLLVARRCSGHDDKWPGLSVIVLVLGHWNVA